MLHCELGQKGFLDVVFEGFLLDLIFAEGWPFADVVREHLALDLLVDASHLLEVWPPPAIEDQFLLELIEKALLYFLLGG